MIREYTMKEQLEIRNRRMKHIDLIQENCESLCWADIVSWAWLNEPGYHGMTIELDRAKECQKESAEIGSCYCGRFVDGKENKNED